MSISSLPKKLQHAARTVRMLGDRLLIAPLEYKHPTLYVAGVTLNKGIVVSAGPGRRRKRKVRFDQQIGHLSTARALYFEDGDETGRLTPMDLRVGDIVEYSFRTLKEWEYDGQKFVIVARKSIYGKSKDKEGGLLWQQSAGYDRHGNFMPDQGNPWSDPPSQ